MYLRVSKDLPLAVFIPLLALLLFLERLPDLRGYALDKPPELFIFLFQHEDFHLLLYALFAVDLLLQALVLLRQIVDGGLILLHLSQVLFQPGEVRPHHLQNLVPLFPGVQHPDFRHRLFYGLLLAGQVYGLLEQPCGNVLALGDEGALAPLEDGERLFHVGVKLMIIVWKLDRFARNRYDSARYKAALKKNGVKVVSATEVISDGAEGIILESVLEGYAEYYSADLSEKVVRGMTENALKSKYNGGTLPIGYQIDSDQCFQLDPLTAPFVREAFQRYDEGATMTQIRDWLNGQGVKNTRGQKMTYNSIQHLLNNRRYIGEYTYRDIVVPDAIPAIVPQDLFDRVQEKLAKNKKAPARHKAEDDYLLTTKLFCGYCGAYLCGESGTSHTGNVHHYYKCVSVKKKRTECHKKSVKKEWIEDLVVNETMKMVMDDTAIEAIVSMLMDLQDRENVNLPFYEQQLREADTAIQNLLNAIQQGILTKSTKGRLEELEATKEELETKIACEKLAKPKVSAEFMTFWLHRFRKLDVRQKSHRKMLIDTFVNAIFLYDDKMVITFNYKDGTDTITFDDLKAALDKEKTGSDLDCSTAPTKPPLWGGFVIWCERWDC